MATAKPASRDEGSAVVDAELAEVAARVRRHAPCSIELPAGAGKTHLIAALATSFADEGGRTLILTHTNAGVDVLRRRVTAMGGGHGAVRVRTIDSWCFNLVRHVPLLAELVVPAHPNWDGSALYEDAAARAICTPAIRRVLSASYDLIVVDEYQDCGPSQHGVVVALHSVLPTVVFGDPLQALFDFDGGTPDWQSEVCATFPALGVPSVPWRWAKGNRDLGIWLTGIRSALMDNQAISLVGAPVAWVEVEDERSKTNACFTLAAKGGSVVALGKVRADCVHVAKRLKGSYNVMEELEGKVLLEFARVLDGESPSAVAVGTVNFARGCATGVAEMISASKRKRLSRGETIGTRNGELAEVYAAVNALLADSHVGAVSRALAAVADAPGFLLYCREAWDDMRSALVLAEHSSDATVCDAVSAVRNRRRNAGRRPSDRVISRPRLAKGLEFDHAVLLDADRYTATELYVALTRGSKSATVVSRSQVLQPVDASRSRGA